MTQTTQDTSATFAALLQSAINEPGKVHDAAAMMMSATACCPKIP